MLDVTKEITETAAETETKAVFMFELFDLKKGVYKNHFFYFSFFCCPLLMDCKDIYELNAASLATKGEIKHHLKNILSAAHQSILVNIDKQTNMDDVYAFYDILKAVYTTSGVPTLVLCSIPSSGTRGVVQPPVVEPQVRYNCLLRIDFQYE